MRMSPRNAVDVAAAVLRASVRADTAYRGAFLARAAEAVASLALSIAFYGLIYSYTSGIGGWNYANILALAGSFEIVRGIVHGLTSHYYTRVAELAVRHDSGDAETGFGLGLSGAGVGTGRAGTWPRVAGARGGAVSKTGA